MGTVSSLAFSLTCWFSVRIKYFLRRNLSLWIVICSSKWYSPDTFTNSSFCMKWVIYLWASCPQCNLHHFLLFLFLPEVLLLLSPPLASGCCCTHLLSFLPPLPVFNTSILTHALMFAILMLTVYFHISLSCLFIHFSVCFTPIHDSFQKRYWPLKGLPVFTNESNSICLDLFFLFTNNQLSLMWFFSL